MSELESEPAVQTACTPRTYLWWAVGATALCFAPLGLVALWFALSTMRAVDRGDLSRAQRSSRRARRWLIITASIGFVVNLLLLAILSLMGGFST